MMMTSAKIHAQVLWIACGWLLVAGCQARPARFADAPPAEAVADDRAIPTPRRVDPVPEVRLSEAYIRRPLIDVLDPTRVRTGGDVNALDEVPRSSWYRGLRLTPDTDNDTADPPSPPYTVVLATPANRRGALLVVDARGRYFEVWRDPPDRPEMATAAGAAASRLLWALGYYTPAVWVDQLDWRDFSVNREEHRDAIRALFASGPPDRARCRVALTRWPIGIDLGPTSAFDARPDDRNDRVPHPDRRTLRALSVLFAWLGMDKLGTSVLRDAYVGAPGEGHVVHYIADTGGAFGADAVVRPEDSSEDDAGRDVWVTLGTFGLYRPARRLTQRRWTAIGEYDEHLPPGIFRTGPPFEPMDRLLPGDAYWAAKRIASVPPPAIEEAIHAAKISDPSARARLVSVLAARGRVLVARAFAGVTPCEVERTTPEGKGQSAALVLRDEAVARGFAQAETTRYRTTLLDERGVRVAGPAEIAGQGARLTVALPWGAPYYLVLRVSAARAGRAPQPPMEVHLERRAAGWAVLGVRH